MGEVLMDTDPMLDTPIWALSGSRLSRLPVRKDL
jgi:hypothetical protein